MENYSFRKIGVRHREFLRILQHGLSLGMTGTNAWMCVCVCVCVCVCHAEGPPTGEQVCVKEESVEVKGECSPSCVSGAVLF